MSLRDALWLTAQRLASAPASKAFHSTHLRYLHGIPGSAYTATNIVHGTPAPAQASAAAATRPRVCTGAPCTLARCTVNGTHGVRSFASSSAAETPAASASSSGSGSGSSTAGEEAGWRNRMGGLLLVPGTVAAFLGYWQLRRREEKLEKLQARRAAMEAIPCSILANPGEVPEYTRVSAEGVYDHERSIYLGPRAKSVMGGTKGGHVLITPLFSERWGKAVLVNRGWVPVEWRSDPAMRAAGQPLGKVSVDGVVRASENRGGFVPDNVGEQWYWLDVPAMARACGLSPDTPLVELLTDTSQRPAVPSTMDVLGGRTLAPPANSRYPSTKSKPELLEFSVMPDGHRNYAITWFTMAAFMLGMGVRAMRLNRRTPRKLPSMAQRP